MNAVLADILDLLDIEFVEENLYLGQNHQTEHVFGGQVLAQAITAAFRTVDASFELHSLHSYFLRAGNWTLPILFEVERSRDGRSFATRGVTAIQNGKAIFILSSSWQRPEPSVEHGPPMPDVPPPEALRSAKEYYRELAELSDEALPYSFRFDALDCRNVEDVNMEDPESHPAIKHTWMRCVDRLPEAPDVHLGMLAYLSDMDFMSTSLLPHPVSRGDWVGASLDHAMWFHRPFRADEWLLFAKESPNAAGARGFVRGHFFNQQGQLVATAAQECLIRPLKPPES